MKKAYAGLIELLVDICKRNGIKDLKWKADKSLIGQPDKQNMTVHRWFANKACPGDYLYAATVGHCIAVNKVKEMYPAGNDHKRKYDQQGLYKVQTGAFTVKSNATALQTKLKSQGLTHTLCKVGIIRFRLGLTA